MHFKQTEKPPPLYERQARTLAHRLWHTVADRGSKSAVLKDQSPCVKRGHSSKLVGEAAFNENL